MTAKIVARARRRPVCFVVAALGLAAVGCGGGGTPETKPSPSAPPTAAAQSFYAGHFSRKPSVAAMTDLGRALFFDPSLGVSGRMACATCHDPRFAYGSPNDRATQWGGMDLRGAGVRAVPSLRYLQTVPPFSEHHFDEAIDDSIDQGPTGGYDWDGRADSTHEQARAPLTSPFEMANANIDDVVARVARGPLADRAKATFGDDVFSDAARGSTALAMCLEVFQQSPKDFYPYSSRYDAYLRGRGVLTPTEQRGLSLFNNPKKGNCASCHPSQIRKGAFPQFTDFGYAAVGVPRNHQIAVNNDDAFFDMGLCGPQRADLAKHKDYCGQFRVPSLRNVGVRKTFFHNGVFHRLEDAVAFYASRDVNPSRWYPRVNGRVRVFDDLPTAYHANINREPPFGGRPGAAPALTDREIKDIVAFLRTLTDADLE